MKSKFVLPLAVAACLPFASTSRAVNYTEGPGDAGDLPATAQAASASTPLLALTSITGSLSLANNVGDCDLYTIFISNPAAFSASTTPFAVGANGFDSQLALFDSLGRGIESNDDAASGGSQSTLPTGNALLSAGGVGTYYLLVSGSGRYAVDNTGNLIFPNYTDGTTDPSGTYGPNSPTATIAGYTGNSSEGGTYVLSIAGAQFVFDPAAAVPEPSTYALLLAGGVGLCTMIRARRSSAK